MRQRHDERPGASHPPIGVQQHGAGTEVHLRGVARCPFEPDGDFGRLLAAQAAHDAHDRRVAAHVAVLALERRMDRAALHAASDPALNDRAMRLGAGDGGGCHALA